MNEKREESLVSHSPNQPALHRSEQPIPSPLSGPCEQLTSSSRTHRTAISIISNSRLLGESLVEAFRAYEHLSVLGVYCRESLRPSMPSKLPGQVALLDANLGQEVTIPWIRHCRIQSASPHVIVLELENEINTILAHISAGVAGFTFQGMGVADVIEVIERVRQGEPQMVNELPPHASGHVPILVATAPPPSILPTPLTPHELEVLRYIAEDYSNQEIATALVIELATVKHHVHNILEKLKLQHRWDAARYAAAQGWFDDQSASP